MTNHRPSRPKQSIPKRSYDSNVTDTDKQMGQTDSLKSIAQSHHLNETQTKDYVKFMQERFPNERDENYKGEWATRFRNKTEWASADNESREALKKANPEVYGTEETRKNSALARPQASALTGYGEGGNRINMVHVSEIAEANRKAGKYFFSESTKKFFKSRIAQSGYKINDDVYFVTSEQAPESKRGYSVRKGNLKTGDVETVGEFNSYSTIGQAKSEILRIVKEKHQ